MKRLLSILLAIAMCIAMFPAAFASETEDARETITLDLHMDNLSAKGEGGALKALEHGNTPYIAELAATDSSYEWVADKSVSNTTVNTLGGTGSSYGSYGRRMQYYTFLDDNSWIVWPEYADAKERMFTIKTNISTEATGYYNIKISGASHTTGGEFAVYVNGQYAGDFNNFENVESYTTRDWTLGNAVKLSEGYNEISLRARKYYRSGREGGSNNASLYLGLIQLIPTSEPTISEIESAIPETIEKDSTAELSAKVKMEGETYRSFGYTDAGVVPTTDNVVKVTSSDPAVIEVTEVVNVQVNDAKNREQILNPTTVTYKLTALKGGTSDITVTAIVDGQTKELTKTVAVPAERETITLNLGASNLGKDNGEGGETYLEKNESINISKLKVMDDIYEVVTDETLAENTNYAVTASGNWVEGANTSTGANSMQFATDFSNEDWSVWPENTEKPKAFCFTFKTNITEAQAGYYRVDITSRKFNAGGEFAIYVGDEYAGDYNSYSAEMLSAATESLNTVKIPAGDAEISLRTRKFYRDKARASIYLGSVKLIPVDKPTISEIESAIPTELSEGDMSDLSAQIKMTDGSYRHFGYTDAGAIPEADETVKVTSNDPTVVEVKDVVVVQKNDAKNREQILDPTTVTYKLAAKKAGTAKITVTAYVDGKTEIKEETITVEGLGADAATDAGNVMLGILTNYSEAVSGVTATGYNVNGSNQVSVGTAVTAEAKDVGDYKFMYWKVGGTTTNGGTFITTDSKLENYVVNTNTSLVAVYEKTNETLKIVEFWNANKQFLSKDDDSEGGITVPTIPAVTGFTTTGKWLIGENKYLIVSDIPVGTTRAIAERNDTGNAITGPITVNGEAVSEALTYDNEIERTVEGAKYWTRDGKVVSYGETYTYHMWDATAIESHTDDIVAVPTVVLDDPANGAYMIEYCVPEGYTKLEAGILFAKIGTPIIGSFSSKAASQSDSCHGQFTAQADDGETVARGYLVYEDKLGNKKVIYAELPSAEE